MLVAELAPRPDAPARMRRLPSRPVAPVAQPASRPVAPVAELVPGRVARPSSAAIAHVTPLAPARFKVQFTASSELEAKIVRATALLRHKIPSGDMAAIFDEAMTVLLAKLEKTRCASTDRPRSSASAVSTSRHVPAAVRRAVWERDEGRCAFVDRQGRRCEAREFLEIHHVEPFGQGGETRLENLRLLCRAHNQYRAELDYGVDSWRSSGARDHGRANGARRT